MINQRTTNRGRSISGLGSIIDGALKQNSLSEGIRPHRALGLWREVVGETLAQASTAETVRGGILFVRARSGAWAHELTLLRGDILLRLNSRLGGAILSDIHFKAGGRRTKPQVGFTQRELPMAPSDSELGLATLEVRPLPADPKAAMLQRINDIRQRAAKTLDWKRANGWVPCHRCKALFEPTFADQAKHGGATGLCPLCALARRQRYS
jgi:predicted nucleic acid-binding Zn ribbon protein